MKYRVDDDAGRNGEHSRYDAEVHSQLRTEQRQHDQKTNQDYQPIWLQPSNRPGESFRKNAD